jgi:phosphoribosyl 1,2-cyclic phosphate phosphodiesterase
MPLYCAGEVEDMIRQAFAYAFAKNAEHLPPGYIPKLVFRQITEEPFTVLGQQIVPIPLIHAQFNVFGFRIGNVAYCTDVNRFPERSWPLLEGLQVLVLDALRHKPHAGHLSVAEALAIIARVRPARAYLTHIAHELDHEATNAQLPAGVELAYDGLKFDF